MDIDTNYAYYIVALSILIAILSSYSGLNIAAKISIAYGKLKFFWILLGAIVMGCGIWSMHFIGMLATHVRIDMSVAYEMKFTLLSLLASILSSLIAFSITMPKVVHRVKLTFGGVVMGSGIAAMHYIGMEAMKINVSFTYDNFYVILSIIISILSSSAALYLFVKFRATSNMPLKILSAILMGTGISSMHYLGMLAVNFHEHAIHTASKPFTEFHLLFSVSVSIFLILFISWATQFFDRLIMEKMAYMDNVTGLPNRNEMNRLFQSYVGKEKVTLMFLDLDEFKKVNDTLGHDIGDSLVANVGERLKHFTNKSQQVYRIGGDEFLFIIIGHPNDYIEQLAKKILATIKKGFIINGNELQISASIGISAGYIQQTSFSTLLKNADTAMYQAKHFGKNQYYVYNDEMGFRETRNLTLERDIKTALTNNEIYIVYQPKWCVETNSLLGFEALTRWNHPALGAIAPNEFIPVAEENGFIAPLTKWTLEKTCAQIKTWESQGIAYPISVNLSTRLFYNQDLVDSIQSLLSKYKLDGALLELEVTESMVFYDIGHITDQLQQIRSLGVKISLDDFGTGYSSISLLDQMPLDSIKLDRLFIKDIETSTRKQAIIRAIMQMANHLQLNVVAEGVETLEHVQTLTNLGCNIMQGYYYGKPQKQTEITKWIQKQKAEIPVV